jgi:tetratricopeptide (TPR) repeat protein
MELGAMIPPLAVPLLVLALAQPPADPLLEVIQAIDQGRYAIAVQMLNPLLEKNPDDPAALFHLGLAYSYLRLDQQAILAYRKLIKVKPELYEGQINLAQLLARNKEYTEARAFLLLAVEQKPKEFRPAILLGDVELALGNAEPARERYKQAAELDAKSVDAWEGLGRAELLLKRPAEAAAALEKAAALAPGRKDLQLQLASAYEAARQLPQAVEAYRKAGDDLVARERMGGLLLELGKHKEAIEHLEFVNRRSPTAAVQFALATAYLRDGRAEESIPLVESILLDAPTNLEIRMFYGRLLRDQKKYNLAGRQFRLVTEAAPANGDAWSELAGMLMLQEQFAEALKALDKAKELGGETAGYYYFRATMLDALRQHKPALEAYQRFLELSAGKNPDEEFKARQRVRIIQRMAGR